MKLIAHRGASAYAPENTLGAFRRALEMGAKAVEFDIAQSRDKALVVIHDPDLKRTAGRSIRVEMLTAKELRATDVGSWFGREFSSEGVPRLSEVVDLVGNKAELHIELKGGCRFYPGIEARLFRLLQKMRPRGGVVISSFDHEALFHYRKLDKAARIGYLLGKTPLERAFKEMRELGAESLNLGLGQSGARIVSRCHGLGLKVLVYTVNARGAWKRLAQRGVDGVFSNFPDLSDD